MKDSIEWPSKVVEKKSYHLMQCNQVTFTIKLRGQKLVPAHLKTGLLHNSPCVRIHLKYKNEKENFLHNFIDLFRNVNLKSPQDFG